MLRRNGHARRARILIVDTTAASRTALAEHLRLSGYEVIEAERSLQALAQAEAYQPDLVILELSRAQIDGEQATRLLRTSMATRHIPIVAIAGSWSGPSLDKARAMGWASFLFQPIAPPTIELEIARVLEQ